MSDTGSDTGQPTPETAPDIERLKTDLDVLRRDFATLAATLQEVAGARGEQGVAALRDYAGQARDQAGEYVADAERVVARNPLLSLAAAFGVGYLVARAMKRD